MWIKLVPHQFWGSATSAILGELAEAHPVTRRARVGGDPGARGGGWGAGEGRAWLLASRSPRGLQGSPRGGLRRAHLGCLVGHGRKSDPWDVHPLALSLHSSQQPEEASRKSPDVTVGRRYSRPEWAPHPTCGEKGRASGLPIGSPCSVTAASVPYNKGQGRSSGWVAASPPLRGPHPLGGGVPSPPLSPRTEVPPRPPWGAEMGPLQATCGCLERKKLRHTSSHGGPSTA